jgi:Fe-S-cluster-containing dehydrogenase component
MSDLALLVDYQYCTGCHSCELACRNEKGLPLEQWGIKLHENGPWELAANKWEWDYIPTPTSACDLCAERVGRGEKAACELHCLANVIEVGPLGALASKFAGQKKKVLYLI